MFLVTFLIKEEVLTKIMLERSVIEIKSTLKNDGKFFIKILGDMSSVKYIRHSINACLLFKR